MKLSRIKKIFQGNLQKNILFLTGGTALAQILNTLSSPIITRIYSPDEYGLLSVISSLLLVFSFASFRYEMAIPIVKKEDEANKLLFISTVILFLTSIIVLFFIIFDENLFLQLFGSESLKSIKYLIPIGIFLNGLNLIARQIVYREKNFKVMSTVSVYQAMVGNSVKIVLGILGFGSAGLVIGRILTSGAGSLKLYKKSKLTYKKALTYSFKEYWYLIKRFKDFPLFQATGTAVIQMRNQFPVLLLAPLYGREIVGYFGLANTIVKIPMTLIGQSVMDVFYAEIADIGEEHPEKILKLSNQLLKQLMVIGMIPTIILLIAGPWLFSLIFGEEWSQAGNYARILSFSILANLIFSPISRVFEVFRMQNIKFLIDLSGLIFMILIFLLSKYLGLSATHTILLYSINMSLVYLVIYIISQQILKKKVREKNNKSLATQIKH